MQHQIRSRTLTIFKAEIAAKYGAPVYSRHPPITAIFPDRDISAIKHDAKRKQSNKMTEVQCFYAHLPGPCV